VKILTRSFWRSRLSFWTASESRAFWALFEHERGLTRQVLEVVQVIAQFGVAHLALRELLAQSGGRGCPLGHFDSVACLERRGGPLGDVELGVHVLLNEVIDAGQAGHTLPADAAAHVLARERLRPRRGIVGVGERVLRA
jgi:hypothetical protein